MQILCWREGSSRLSLTTTWIQRRGNCSLHIVSLGGRIGEQRVVYSSYVGLRKDYQILKGGRGGEGERKEKERLAHLGLFSINPKILKFIKVIVLGFAFLI